MHLLVLELCFAVYLAVSPLFYSGFAQSGGRWCHLHQLCRLFWFPMSEGPPKHIKNRKTHSTCSTHPLLFKKSHSAPRVSIFLMCWGVARVSEYFLISCGVDFGGFCRKLLLRFITAKLKHRHSLPRLWPRI